MTSEVEPQIQLNDRHVRRDNSSKDIIKPVTQRLKGIYSTVGISIYTLIGSEENYTLHAVEGRDLESGAQGVVKHLNIRR